MKRTYENLAKAFIGESQARNRYTYYAKTAKKEGFEKLSEVFLLTAENESQHAKWLLRLINQLKEKDPSLPDEIKVEGDVERTMADTIMNLKSAINGERHEHESMYPEFAKIAREEGLDEIANRLEAIAIAEEHHKQRYEKYLKYVETNTMFEDVEDTVWMCMECGYVHRGKNPPEVCPSCSHPKAYFQRDE
ncbi:MAG: rubrerythrin family protein [Candidatus Nanoarchaeia archaeon]|nr:rubrerythrin family protein [Candidatus Nanoarchaeia archaeon]